MKKSNSVRSVGNRGFRAHRGGYRNRIIALILSVVMVICLVPVVGKTEEAHANEQEKTITGLGTGMIGNPTDGETTGLTGWTGSYVYYGKYNGSPVKYRVLTVSTSDFNSDADNTAGRKTMLLDCDSTLYAHEFDNNSKVWADSTVKEDLNGNGFLLKEGAFTAVEKEAIAASTKGSSVTGDGNGWSSLGWTSLSGEKIFLLDAKEATRPAYGYKNTDSSSYTKKKTGADTYWWLRSADCDVEDAGCVDSDGELRSITVNYSEIGVSPAFNLNLSSVIFSSLINGSEADRNAEYKLTVLDKDMAISVTDGQQVTVDVEGNFSVPYTITGNNNDKANRVSVLILDHPYIPGESVADTDKFDYIKLNTTAPFSTSGTGTFRLPEKWNGKKAGVDYYIYILAEKVHTNDPRTAVDESKLTDYASSPVSLFPITGLGTGLIGNPTDGDTAGLTKWTGSYVYYGKYNGTPVRYRVLDTSTSGDFTCKDDNGTTVDTMLLDCDSTLLYRHRFDYYSNVWADSEVKKDLNGTGFLSKEGTFTALEKEAIATSTKGSAVTGDGNGSNALAWCSLNGEKIFLLDAKEATRPAYGYKNTDSSIDTKSDTRVKTVKTGVETWWWLRSPISYNSDIAGSVHDGLLEGHDMRDSLDVSPAFNINLSSVIFSSLIPGTSDEYKLTVKDSAMTIALNGDTVKNGDTVTVPYLVTNDITDEANKVEATRVTVLFLDHAYVPGEAVVNTSDSTKYAYIKLDTGDSFSTKGRGTFEIPDAFKNKTFGTEYRIYLFAEEENGAKETDYASNPVEITHIHSFEYVAGTGNLANTITATCINDGCGLTESFSIIAPQLNVYGGTESTAAGLSGADAFNSATENNVSVSDIKYTGINGTDYSESTIPPVNAGKYKASITVVGKTAEVSYEINKADTTVSTKPSTTAITYGDSLAESSISGGVVIASVSGESTTVAGAFEWGTATTKPTVSDSGVTTYKAVFTPDDDTNYKTAEVDLTLTVNPKEITVRGIKAVDKTYNGNEVAELDLRSVKLEGVFDSDKDKLGVTAKGKFEDSNVGNNKKVIIYDLQLTGDAAANYKLAASGQQSDAKAEIFKLASKIKEVPAAKTGLVYTGDNLELITKGTAENGTLVYALTETGAAAPADDKYSADIPTAVNAGEYTVYYKVIGDTNYNDVAVANIDVAIKRASQEAPKLTSTDETVSGKNDGTITGLTTAMEISTEGEDKGFSAVTDISGTGFVPGTYFVRYAEDKNHEASTSVTITIKAGANEPKPDPKPQPDPVIPTPVVTSVPEEPDTGSKTVTNKDGSTTTTTKTKNEDGTITESTVREWKNGDKNITEIIKDEDGKVISTLNETVRISKKGTKTEKTDIQKADGYHSNSSVKTYKSGKEVSSSSTTFANGAKQAYTETKNADGTLTRKVMDTNTKGVSTLTVTTVVWGEDDSDTTGTDSSNTGNDGTTSPDGDKTSSNSGDSTNNRKLVKTVTKYKVTGDGKIRLTSIKTEGDNAIIPKTVTFDGQKNMIVSLGKGLFKGMKGIKEIYIYAENLKKIYAGAFDGVPADAKFYIKAADANIKKIVRMIKKSGFGKVDYTKI